MIRTYAATFLNFFFPGAGYLLLGVKPLMAVAWLVGVLGLTYVELGVKEAAPEFYLPMFASVFVMNLAFAHDAFLEGKKRVAEGAASTAAAA